MKKPLALTNTISPNLRHLHLHPFFVPLVGLSIVGVMSLCPAWFAVAFFTIGLVYWYWPITRNLFPKTRYWWMVPISTLLFYLPQKPTNAQGIFAPGVQAMQCIVDAAAQGGNTAGTLFTQLPMILFTTLTVILFGYFVYTVVKAISAYGRGEEVSHVIQLPLFTFGMVIVLFIFQNMLFGTGGC